jgi:pilus assembly protein CpaC
MNRVWNVLLLAVFCLLPLVAQADQKTVRIDMYSGEVRTIPVQHIERVAVGNGKLLTTTVLDKGLLLLAEGAGDTSLVIWTKSGARSRYHVHITSRDVAFAYSQLAELLKSFPGIHVDRVGDNVMVSGTASKDDLKRIDKAA